MLPFILQKSPHFEERPVWDGKAFVIGQRRVSILEYSENFEGWSDDLTKIHEEAAGDSHPIDIASRKDALNQINKQITRIKPVILEIGCSSGFFLKELQKKIPNAIIVGADVVKEPLYRLANELLNVPLFRFDLLKCPLPSESFDIVVMLNVLEHIEDDDLALRNAYNLLRKGGSLIIEVPAGPYLYDTYDSQLCHFRRYSSRALQKKLRSIGFEIERKSHIGFTVFPVFALIKIFNKFKSSNKKKNIMIEQAIKLSCNRLVKLALMLESDYLFRYDLPFGIRVCLTAVKP